MSFRITVSLNHTHERSLSQELIYAHVLNAFGGPGHNAQVHAHAPSNSTAGAAALPRSDFVFSNLPGACTAARSARRAPSPGRLACQLPVPLEGAGRTALSRPGRRKRRAPRGRGAQRAGPGLLRRPRPVEARHLARRGCGRLGELAPGGRAGLAAASRGRRWLRPSCCSVGDGGGRRRQGSGLPAPLPVAARALRALGRTLEITPRPRPWRG